MKKILVVLLIAAVAGGVFAQGNWSLSGGIDIGTYIDLDPRDSNGDPTDDILYVVSGYWAPYNYYNTVNGKLDLAYSLDALRVGLTFNTINAAPGDDRINGSVDYDGGTYKMQISSNVEKLIAGAWNVGRLWGYYKMLDDLVHLEIAYNSRDTEFWFSDTTAGFGGDGGATSPILKMDRATAHYSYSAPFGNGDRRSFTKVDHNNYLLTSIDLDGLSFGLMLPSLFYDGTLANNAANAQNRAGGAANAVANIFPKLVGGNSGNIGYKLVDQVLKQMVFGVKFQMSPVEFAAQFVLEDYGVYFGGKWFAGPVTIGLSFMGVMQPTVAGVSTGETIMKVGGSVDYNAGSFGAALKGFYGIAGDSSAQNFTQIGVEPSFFYNVIPSHLQFTTDVGFYFTNVYNGSDKDVDASTVRWGVQPQLFWNFMGTGAGGYWSWGTGMLVRYRLLSDVTNALDVTFRFSF